MSARSNVVVLRTFSKAYGLAGLRVGYAVGPTAVVTELRKAQLPFGVTAGAEQAAAIASLAAEPELLRRVEVLVAERDRVMHALCDTAASTYRDAAGQLRLAAPRRPCRTTSRGAVREAGVVVRPFAGDGVRVTIGEPEANDRWLPVLRDFLRL